MVPVRTVSTRVEDEAAGGGVNEVNDHRQDGCRARRCLRAIEGG